MEGKEQKTNTVTSTNDLWNKIPDNFSSYFNQSENATLNLTNKASDEETTTNLFTDYSDNSNKQIFRHLSSNPFVPVKPLETYRELNPIEEENEEKSKKKNNEIESKRILIKNKILRKTTL